jgi:hypothetical protein
MLNISFMMMGNNNSLEKAANTRIMIVNHPRLQYNGQQGQHVVPTPV